MLRGGWFAIARSRSGDVDSEIALVISIVPCPGDAMPTGSCRTQPVLGLTGPGSVVVPGHGAVVDRDFVEDQRNAIGVVAETVRDLASRGVPVGEALDAAEWPFPKDALEHAVRRVYEHLPRSQKRLPLI